MFCNRTKDYYFVCVNISQRLTYCPYTYQDNLQTCYWTDSHFRIKVSKHLSKILVETMQNNGHTLPSNIYNFQTWSWLKQCRTMATFYQVIYTTFRYGLSCYNAEQWPHYTKKYIQLSDTG